MQKVISDLDSLGYRKVLIRTDGEGPITDLFAEVKKRWWGEIIKVESMVGDSNTNSEAEQAVQKIQDEMRTFKSSLDDAIKDRIDPSHPRLTGLVEHVASVDRRTSIGQDGRTPLHRTRGRHGRDVMAEFAECVHFMPLRGNVSDKRQAKSNFDARFMDGVF